jgi:DNA uptake protein ComE-like DNA-binding protein
VVFCSSQRASAGKVPVSPVVAWVFGMKMNWQKVTAETLRWIPGIHRQMAARLVRIRDIYDVKFPSQLAAFPHIGGKTIQRLQKTCFFPDAN